MRTLLIVLCAATLSGCATYQNKVNSARSLLRNGQPEQAAKSLELLAQTEGKDQLVYLLDYATALQQAGKYDESAKAFLIADKMSEVKDYYSISKIGSSLLFSEEMVQYKGEDYEKVLINAMLAINFLMMEKYDSALVETRRLNEKLYRYKYEAKKDYEQNPFARYLGAIIWEHDRKWDDAYIDYHEAFKLNPNIPLIEFDLLRAAANARRWDEFNKWKKEFGIQPKPEWKNKDYGELVLVYQQGWGPRKRPYPDAPRYPKLYPVNSWTLAARMDVEGGPQVQTQPIHSVEEVAIRVLNDAMGKLVAKRVAGVVAKEVVADQLRQKDELLGELLRIGMHLSDRADLRQWSTLPESFQVARVFLKKGEYKVKVLGLGANGKETGEVMETRTVKVVPGRKTFLAWRSFK